MRAQEGLNTPENEEKKDIEIIDDRIPRLRPS